LESGYRIRRCFHFRFLTEVSKAFAVIWWHCADLSGAW